jgi:hypothetical protein
MSIVFPKLFTSNDHLRLNWTRIEAAVITHLRKIIVLVLLLHAMVQVSQIQRDDITADEEDHLTYGVQIWKGNPSRRVEGRDFRSTMPVTAIHALPRVFEQILQPGKVKTDWGKSDIRSGRYLNLLFTLGLLVYIFLLSQTLFSPLTGLFCLIMAAADPNMLAHGHLVTTDMAATFFCIATLYHLLHWIDKKQTFQFMLFTLCIAFAQIAKVNNLLLYPISTLVLLLGVIQQKQFNYKRSMTFLFLFLFIQVMVINLAFQFEQTGFRLDQADFSSSVIKDMVTSISFPLRSPLPLPYIDTFDKIYFEIEKRDGLPLNYLMGERSTKGFWNYFFVCMGIKTPLASIALILSSLVLIILHLKHFKKQILFLIFPALIIYWFISSATVQNGYRYALPVLALGIIASGALISLLLKARFGRALVFLALAAVLLETFSFKGGYLPFTNVLVGNKKNAWTWLADSNLNWEQNHARLKDYLKSHPELIYQPAGPVKGRVLVHVNDLAGIWEPDRYEWLRVAYKPESHLWHSYLLFDTR